MPRLAFIGPETPAETILAAGMLSILQDKFAPESISVICPHALAGFYNNAPFPCQTVPYDSDRTSDPLYPAQILRSLPNPDICINVRTTRDAFSDAIALGCGAAQTIAHSHSPARIPDDTARKYSRLAPHSGVIKLEVQRHRDLLKLLDIDVERVSPVIWPTPADSAWSQAFFNTHQINPQKTIILFPEASHPLAAWPGFSKALAPLCQAAGLAIIAVGESLREPDTQQLQAITAAGVKLLDLRGQASYFQVAALMRLARAAAGLENIYAHIACAVGCRNAVILAGGAFGRWLPYSSLTSAITAPLHCLGCNWHCRFEQPYCSVALAPFMLQVALHMTLNAPGTPELPRLFIQHPDFGLADLVRSGKLPPADCFLNPDALPPFLYDIFLVTSSNLSVVGTPPSLYGSILRRVSVQVEPARSIP